jgi:hypothetical protein
MSVKSFKFVSPGIFVNEIDNSALPEAPAQIGPLVIGRTLRGPAMRPVKVNSLEEFINVFGPPVGGGQTSDVWRNPGETSPLYCPYAVQAYLANSSPITVVRLLGEESVDASSTGYAGWKTTQDPDNTLADCGGAFGLFLIQSGTNPVHAAGSMTVGNYADVNNGQTFSLTATDGAICVFTIDTAVSTTTSNIVGTNGISSDDEMAAQIIATINDATAGSGSGVGYTALEFPASDGYLEIVQDTVGVNGNRAIADAISGITVLDMSGGVDGTWSDLTGTLAAVFYADSGSTVLLTGSTMNASSPAPVTAAARTFIQSVSDYHAFDIVVTSSVATSEKIRVNFNVDSPDYIRNVCNTNPTLLNGTISNTTKPYFLGETYTRNVLDLLGNGSTTQGATMGMILPLEASASTDSSVQWQDRQIPAKAAQSGWLFANDSGLDTSFDAYNAKKLFKFHSLKAGTWDQRNVKISIQDIRAPLNSTTSKYSTFTVVVRKMSDNDARLLIMEQFSNCNLNPSSPSYIARKIGDKYYDFDAVERRIKEYGQYANQSKYIRMEMDLNVDAEGAPDVVPFGFFGPSTFKGFTVMSGADAPLAFGSDGYTPPGSLTPYSGAMGHETSYGIPKDPSPDTGLGRYWAWSGDAKVTASFRFPKIPLRLSSSDEGLPLNSKAYWGFSSYRALGDVTFNKDVVDVLEILPDRGFYTETFAAPASIDTNFLEIPVIFTLDDIRATDPTAGSTDRRLFYESGSRQADTSISADAAGYTKPGSSTTKYGYRATLLAGADRFTLPLVGGSDGFDITEKDPLRNSQWDATTTEVTSYSYNTVKQAIDIVRDAEIVDFNVLNVPGITNEALTLHAIETAESRADALAVIDLTGDYAAASENTLPFSDRVGYVDAAVSNIKARNLDSSYGCAYYPWVQIFDKINNQYVWVPPSVVGLGTMSNSQARSEVWFAPAGFNRGGLSAGAAGIPVTAITQKLSSTERDDLYEVNINPIASFPAEGIVVFGQKTLQATPSALDRISVRRLLILLKKTISRMATTVLFDQNIDVTWNRFSGMVEPFLRSVQLRYGLEDYKIALDRTTTTPELVDRNIMYAQIYLKPAKSIEFIAIDFNISRSGASFED